MNQYILKTGGPNHPKMTYIVDESGKVVQGIANLLPDLDDGGTITITRQGPAEASIVISKPSPG